MIAACPQCKTRYRVAAERLQPDGARLRCTRCQTVFRVRLPAAATRPAPAASGPASAGATSPDRRRLVLLADPDPQRCKATAETLSRAGLEPAVVHDGVEAILALQRTLPRAVVLDAALPRMFGLQICELVKRNESLRATWVVLAASVHDEPHQRRPANDLYGADAYVERSELPAALLPVLRGFGLPVRPAAEGVHDPSDASTSAARLGGPPPAARAPAAPPPAARAPSATAPVPRAPSATAPVAAGPSQSDEERARAERLARIIVSDIVLYNEEKFAAAVQAGNVLEALASELEEGRQLFERRTGASARTGQDPVADEMMRVARARGMC